MADPLDAGVSQRGWDAALEAFGVDRLGGRWEALEKALAAAYAVDHPREPSLELTPEEGAGRPAVSDAETHLSDLRGALQEHIPNDDEDYGVLTGYVVVAQWSDGAGREWLTHTAGTINDEGPPIWTVKGWLVNALDRADDGAVDEE